MIAFDIGGVLSKYPDTCRRLIESLMRGGHAVCVITDQHDHAEICRTLATNRLMPPIIPQHVYCADYEAHGDACKAVLMRRLGVTILVDDHPGYVVWPWPEPAPMRLLVQPDVRRPYWAPEWRCEGGEFGRRAYLDADAGGATLGQQMVDGLRGYVEHVERGGDPHDYPPGGATPGAGEGGE